MPDPLFRGAPRGRELVCRGWEQEGALRCLLNNLDPEVAEDAAGLVVYGGRGRAARSPEALAGIVAALERLGPGRDAGRPVGEGGRRAADPRRRPACAHLHRDGRAGLVGRGLVPAARGRRTDDVRADDRRAGGSTSARRASSASPTRPSARSRPRTSAAASEGRRVLTAGLGGMGGAQGFAVTRNGGRALIVEVDPARAERRLGDGWVELVAGYDEALAAHLDPERPWRGRARRERRRRRPAPPRRGGRVRRRHRSDRRPRPPAGLCPARVHARACG